MTDLSLLEAGLLEAENADRHASLAIGGVAVLEGPAEPFDTLLHTLAERVPAVPRFTDIVSTHPLRIRSPRWEPDPDFDIHRHVRRVALPAPGDEAALFELTADIMARRLDRDRPLWECWVIEGLADGKWAILVKIHHCIADGIAATAALAKLFDGGATFPTRVPAPASFDPVRWVRSAVQASAELPGLLTRAAQMAAGILRPPSTSLTGRMGDLRRYTAVRLPLSDVRHVADTFGVTINDVALAAITRSFRAVLLSRNECPRTDALRALVPVSMRGPGVADATGIQVSAMLASLPVDIADPLQCLHEVHRRLERSKHSGQSQAAAALLNASRLVPFALSAWTVRLATALPQHGVATLTTNVAGPRTRQQFNGHPVTHVLPVPPLGLGVRTGVAIYSYADELAFGIFADRDGTPESELLAQSMHDAVGALVEISGYPGLHNGHRRAPSPALARR